ncbi:hypothetical protein [Azospirillum argentinense]|uniref:hypothetical protein n=1 Tax=Azospirillum argentinense TaxID=2970906 RepID=UPI0032E033CF
MNAMFPFNRAACIPPRPVTIHKADHAAVTFEGFGTVTVTGPRRSELTGMVAVMPQVLRQLAVIAKVLRDRDGSANRHVMDLENVLAEAGISTAAPLDDEVPPMSPVTPASQEERFALLLGDVADKLDAILADRKALHSTPTPIRDALGDISSLIRAALKENRQDEQPVEGGAE